MDRKQLEVLEVNCDSVAIQRLVREVLNDQDRVVSPAAYNRVYHRHNRS